MKKGISGKLRIHDMLMHRGVEKATGAHPVTSRQHSRTTTTTRSLHGHFCGAVEAIMMLSPIARRGVRLQRSGAVSRVTNGPWWPSPVIDSRAVAVGWIWPRQSRDVHSTRCGPNASHGATGIVSTRFPPAATMATVTAQCHGFASGQSQAGMARPGVCDDGARALVSSFAGEGR